MRGFFSGFFRGPKAKKLDLKKLNPEEITPPIPYSHNQNAPIGSLFGANDYSRPVHWFGEGDKAHGLAINSSKGSPEYQRDLLFHEAGKITGRILKVALHVSDTVYEGKNAFSIEDLRSKDSTPEQKVFKTRITADEYFGTYPEMSSEIFAECEILAIIFGDIDHSPTSESAPNIGLYSDGSFSVFDFEQSRNFFKGDITSTSIFKKLRYNKANLMVFKKMLPKVDTLITFYESKEGQEVLFNILSNSKQDLDLVFPQTNSEKLGENFPTEFHKLMLSRLHDTRAKLKKALGN